MPKQHPRPLLIGLVAGAVMAAGGAFATPAAAAPSVNVQASGSTVTVSTPKSARGCTKGAVAEWRSKAGKPGSRGSAKMTRQRRAWVATFTGLKSGRYTAYVRCEGSGSADPGTRDFTVFD